MEGVEPKAESAAFDPEAYLNSLQPIGWKLGLERMHRLTSVLGLPQNRFASIHVVGTNGKSSVTRMAAALLEAHGVGSGACLSPHITSWAERVLIGGSQIGAGAFAASVKRTAEAAAVVDRSLEQGEATTQFEVSTAAAFVALASARVEVGVIEAGLGGRLDATNVVPSRVTVLTSVGLDHTDWLGETEIEIAAEKLAVLRDQSTLVLGQVPAEVGALAERLAAERGARAVRAPDDPGAELPLLALGGFQRRNFAVACSAVEPILGDLDPARVEAVAAGLEIEGRLQRIAADPPTFIDAAHNADGAAALADALPGIAAASPVVACVAVLAEKDAPAMIETLAGVVHRFVCTELDEQRLSSSGRPGARAWPAAELAAICRAAGAQAVAEPDPGSAVERAREAAAELGGILVVAGSHYLLADARDLAAGP